MAGAIDLFAGAPSIHGAHLFKVDKSPLDQLDGGVQGIIGKQAQGTGNIITTTFESILRAILGFDPLSGFLQPGDQLLGTLGNLSTYFGNVEAFLGNLNPLDPSFDPIAAVSTFITTMIDPLALLAPLVGNVVPLLHIPGLPATQITSGQFPMSMIFGLADALAGFDPTGISQQIIDAIVNGLGTTGTGHGTADLFSVIQTVLTGNSPLSALNIFGQLLPGQIPLIPLSQIGQASPNLLTNPVLDAPDSVAGSGIWSFDGTVGRTALGSLTTTAAGVLREVVSNEIQVTQGQTVDITAFAKWTGLTYTGTSPITVGVAAYLNGTQVGTTTLAGPVSPPANSGSWNLYSGSYPVPAGVDTVRMRLTMDATATAGQVWFDDLSASKSGTMPQSFITDLESTFTGIFDVFGGGLATLQNFVPNLLSMLHVADPASLTGSTSAFDPTALVTSWITGLINPLELLAPLVAGVVPAANVPPLDASQITTGAFPDTLFPGLGELLTSLLGGFTGSILGPGGSPPTQGDVGSATANQTITMAQMGAAINNLTAQLAALQTSTTVAVDDFSRVAPNLDAALWDAEVITTPFLGGGYPSTDGAQAIWNVGGGADTICTARFIGANHTAASDNTETAIVFGSPIGGLNGTSAVDIHGRMSADKRTSIRARVQSTNGMTTLYLHSRVAGVEALIGTQPLPANLAIAPGTSGRLICGTAVSSRQFIIEINNTEYTFTEIGTTSQLGVGFRERGMGWFAGGLLIFGQTQAAAIAHWTSIDVGGVGGTPPPPTGGGTYDGGTAAGQDPGFVTYDGGNATASGTPTVIDGGSA